MKPASLVWKSLVGVACITFMLGTAMGAERKSESKITKEDSKQYRSDSADGKLKKNIVIFSVVTGSLIPQRVVIKGQQVNSAYPLYVIQGNDLLRSGSTDVAGILRNDPSITIRRH
jgi:hypothetical protein